MAGPLEPIKAVTAEEGTPSPKLVTTLPYPWEQVVQAYNIRFPSHPAFPYLKGSTVPYLETSNKETRLTRIVSLDMGFPGWIKKITGMEVFTVREDAVIDERARIMSLRSTNISLQDTVRMYEECIYRQHPENPEWTQKELIAYLDLVYCRRHVCLGLKKNVEHWARGLFTSRAKNAVQDEMKLIATGTV